MNKHNTILLVEDSEDDAFFFTHLFRESGFDGSLHHSPDGRGAVEFMSKAAAENHLPRAVFLDLKMPRFNGFEFLEWLRPQKYASEVPVYVLSGSADARDKERAALAGAAGYFVKPVLLADLQRILSITVGRERRAKP